MTAEQEVELQVEELVDQLKRLHPFNVFDRLEQASLRAHLVEVMSKTILWEREGQEEIIRDTLQEFSSSPDFFSHTIGASALRLAAHRQSLRRQGKTYK
jgi:hypothetical protein